MPIILDGTLGITFPDNVRQSTAAKESGIGVGQGWVQVTRTRGVNYVNDTGKPIMAAVYTTRSTVSTSGLNIIINGIGIPIAVASNSGGGNYAAGAMIIPVGATYSYTTFSEGNSSEQFWELRSDGYSGDAPTTIYRDGIGIDQEWAPYSRSAGVNYQNTTSKPIMIAVQTTGNQARVYVGATLSVMHSVGWNNASLDNEQDNVTVIVPRNHYYNMSGAFSQVYELR
jgi:hypothetical protein